MIKKLTSIRFTYIRSHLYALFLTTLALLSIFLMVYVLFTPVWLTLGALFTFISVYFILGLIISFYAGFKSSSSMKERIDYLSVIISQYANGNYQSTIHFVDNDEITRIGNELNELGEKLQNQVKSLQRMADEKSAFSKSAHKTAVIEERQRLARDFHDSVSQQLFALTMMAEAGLQQIDANPELAKSHFQEVVNAGRTAQTEMRALLLHLRPVYLSGDTLPEGVRKLITELEQKSQIDFKLDIDETLSLSDTTEEHVFRIIQESLSNILRHAQADQVKIQILQRAKELFIQIVDNGQGFDLQRHSSHKTSYGLKTMQERSEELGGTLSIRSNQGKGTYIDIRIPQS